MSGIRKQYKALGIMSGTSMDGLDLALCEFHLNNNGIWTYELVDSHFIAYEEYIAKRLNSAYHASARQLIEIDTEFGKYLGEKANLFLKGRTGELDLIASHGQTIFHDPNKGYTCQVGSGTHIAAITNCVTVNDFRSMDVAKGGQGAPLVPIGDMLLFGDYDACVNIGGFANFSFKHEERMLAYDICPANIVLNEISSRIGSSYDKDGRYAQSGQVLPELLEKLEKLSYYTLPYPKSLGKEWVDINISPLLKNSIQPIDLIATITEHVSIRISSELDKIDGERVLFTGGGAKNKFLMKRIKEKAETQVIIPSEKIIDMKEAIIFAFLGVLRLRNETNCLSSVTGAFSDSIGGIVHLP